VIYNIKPLEWRHNEQNVCVAYTNNVNSPCTYSIFKYPEYPNFYLTVTGDSSFPIECERTPTLADAKKVAEAHHRRQVERYLEPVKIQLTFVEKRLRDLRAGTTFFHRNSIYTTLGPDGLRNGEIEVRLLTNEWDETDWNCQTELWWRAPQKLDNIVATQKMDANSMVQELVTVTSTPRAEQEE